MIVKCGLVIGVNICWLNSNFNLPYIVQSISNALVFS